ncbi:dynein light chain, cytosolic [Usnea florida]
MTSVPSSQAQLPGPIPIPRLTDIANDACDTAFHSVTSYEHASTSSWNTSIINTILQSLISEVSTSGQQPLHKFAVTSTIIQHTTVHSKSVGDTLPDAGSQDATGAGSAAGRRGMHSACAAYWDNEKDGMWSFKYEKAESKGFDVVLSILWISIV